MSPLSTPSSLLPTNAVTTSTTAATAAAEPQKTIQDVAEAALASLTSGGPGGSGSASLPCTAICRSSGSSAGGARSDLSSTPTQFSTSLDNKDNAFRYLKNFFTEEKTSTRLRSTLQQCLINATQYFGDKLDTLKMHYPTLVQKKQQTDTATKRQFKETLFDVFVFFYDYCFDQRRDRAGNSNQQYADYYKRHLHITFVILQKLCNLMVEVEGLSSCDDFTTFYIDKNNPDLLSAFCLLRDRNGFVPVPCHFLPKNKTLIGDFPLQYGTTIMDTSDDAPHQRLIYRGQRLEERAGIVIQINTPGVPYPYSAYSYSGRYGITPFTSSSSACYSPEMHLFTAGFQEEFSSAVRENRSHALFLALPSSQKEYREFFYFLLEQALSPDARNNPEYAPLLLLCERLNHDTGVSLEEMRESLKEELKETLLIDNQEDIEKAWETKGENQWQDWCEKNRVAIENEWEARKAAVIQGSTPGTKVSKKEMKQKHHEFLSEKKEDFTKEAKSPFVQERVNKLFETYRQEAPIHYRALLRITGEVIKKHGSDQLLQNDIRGSRSGSHLTFHMSGQAPLTLVRSHGAKGKMIDMHRANTFLNNLLSRLFALGQG